MKITDNKNNRLLIYFIYDKDGIADDYIIYMLNGLKKHVRDIRIVSNGMLENDSRKRLEKITPDILERENKGFDVWAYKEAMEISGYDRLLEYDEIILMNYTIMGPVYPFCEMFDSMDNRDLDFWGITKFHEFKDGNPFGEGRYDYLPEHIQSHFIAIRRSMVSSEEFREYWQNMKMIESYQDSVSSHESVFTKYFSDMGYKWQVYADSEDYRELTFQPIIGAAKRMISEKRCPVFKRRSFMQDYDIVINESCGQEAVMLYEYLDKKTDFDVNLLWDNLLRTENMADIKKNMQLNYVLPKSSYIEGASEAVMKTALIIHIYFYDLIDYCAEYAKSMPDYADIYVTTDSEEKKEKILESFGKLNCGKLSVKVIPNRGRDVSAFVIESKAYIMDYDLVCFMHDKKVGQLKPGSIGEGFSYKCFENMLASKHFVKNVIKTFKDNERMGMLMPAPPNHGDYYITLGLEWGMNYEITKKLADKLELKVDISEKKEPVSPLGTMFWVRPEAMKKLFSYGFSYEDMPEEPNNIDGTLLHAIERIYGYVVQDAGYYNGWLFSDDFSRLELTNLYHMLHRINEKLFFDFGIAGTHQRLMLGLDDIEYYNANRQGKLYYASLTENMSEKTSRISEPVVEDKEKNRLRWVFSGFEGVSDITHLRFDPGESGNMILRDLNIEIYFNNGKVLKSDADSADTNGIRIKDGIVFIAGDPQIMLIFPKQIKEEIKNIIITAEVEEKISDTCGREIADIINKSKHKRKKFKFI